MLPVAVSIVCYKTPLDELGTVLDCLQQASVERIDIIDNAREDRIRDFCQDRPVNYIPADNRGYGAGNNISMRKSLEADTRYHLVLNSDIVFTAADLEALVGYMDSNPQVAAVHPRIVGTDGEDQYTARMLPTPSDLILRRFLPGFLCRKKRDRYLLKHLDHNKCINVSYIQGSFMLMRTSALRECGLFDERFFMYPEDIDLSRRLAQVGPVVYNPVAKVVHAHRAASYKSARMTMVHITNMIKYFNKWGWFSDPYRKDNRTSLHN